MREMKDSGIEWIGEIPKTWDIVRVKEKYNFTTGFTPDTKIADYYADEDYGYEWVTIADMQNGKICTPTNSFISEQYVKASHLKQLPKNALLYSFKLSLGKTAIIDRPIFTNEAIACFKREKRNNINFLKYSSYLIEFNAGTNIYGAKILNQQLINDAYLTFPPLKEQQLIADFLDKKCSEIDHLSQDIETQIETLKEYKKSIITEAVTKGLDPNVEMKDSGIEWIGMIPVHWKIKKGKFCFAQKSDKGNKESLTLLSPTQNYGVIPQTLYEELSGFSAVKLNDKTDLNQLKTVHKGAFIISLRSFQGGFEYSEYEGVVSPAYQVFYSTIPVAEFYYKYLFKTQSFIDKINSYTMSLRDGKSIAFSDFGKTYIPIPPVEEQEKIANYIKKQCAEINAIITDKKEQLETLAEYKKSLIYEYITGKKEVYAGEL